MASVLSAAGYEPLPMFEPKARAVYALIALELVAAIALYSALGLSFSSMSLAAPSGAIIAIFAAAFAARRGGFPRIATWLEATALAYIAGLSGWALLYPGTVLAGPYADWWLSAADRALGFDFPAIYSATKHWPMMPLYRSFEWQAAAIIPLLTIFRRDVWPFVLALSVALVLTDLAYPFAPAVGPVAYYHLGGHGDWTPTIEALRDRGVRQITASMLVGMVSLPSYHAAAGAIAVWATWPVRLLRWPFAVLNAAMIFTTVPYGQHYLIDVIAGLGVAVVAISLSGRAVSGRFRRC